MMQSPMQLFWPWRWFVVVAIILLFFYGVRDILLPFITGVMIAYLLDPLADRLERRMGRTWATVTVTVVFFVICIGTVAAVVPMLLDQVQKIARDLPHLMSEAKRLVYPMLQDALRSVSDNSPEDAQDALLQASNEISGVIRKLLLHIIQSGAALLNFISLLLITPVVSFYLLRDWDRITARGSALLPRQYKASIVTMIQEMDQVISGFLRGQLNVCLVLGLFYAVALSVAGLKYGVLVGIISGILVLIPYLGTVVAGMLAVGLAWFQFNDIADTAIILGIFVFGQIVEGNVLTPKLVGDKIGLHPVWLIFGMLAGAALFGMVGVMLAVPVTAVIGVVVRHVVQEYERDQGAKQIAGGAD